ncbi:hypothetical protein SDC9_179777 [bioreactor metagenome]|uniref:Uncharacterized protein n=1 Tax=bioreactor metagenome TaxID=1076179 RepID=A0A645H2S3_9ZZZZ
MLGNHLLDQIDRRLINRLSGDGEMVVDQANHVALFDLVAVELRVPNGIGHRAADHARHRFLHRFLVFRNGSVLGIGHAGGDSLRNRLGRNQHNAFLRQLARLLCREDDVGVVGQHKHVSRVDLVDRGRNGVDARIHRLPAGDQRVHRERTEELVDTVAGAHRKQAKFLFVALAFRHEFAVLFTHVFNLEFVQFAESERHLQHLAR